MSDVTRAAGVQKSVVPIGIFDGMHRGHQAVLARAVGAAKDRDARVVVITFDPHPGTIIDPGAVPLMLVTVKRRIELLKEYGADDVVLLEFTHDLSMQTAQEFIEQTLVARLNAVQIVVGSNFRFGHRAGGDVALLRKFGLEVDDVPLLTDGEVISSTYIRKQVAEGDVASAAEALGRLHFVEGSVVRGDARGRELGFPTANVGVPAGIAIPADGVYAGYLVRASGDRLKAAISVGTNPTFDGQARTVEAYVIDEGHDLDLYDEHVLVEFAERLRGMVKYEGIEPLIAQMNQDVIDARTKLT